MFAESWGNHPAPSDIVIDWIWTGILGPGQVTLLTGLWKTGKTTLLSHLLAHRQTAAALLDLAVHPGRTAVVTEETRQVWARRQDRLGFGPDVCFFFRPFRSRPSPDEFRALIDQLIGLHKRADIDLVVLDPLSRFLPLRSKNSPEAMLQALEPLHALTDAGLAVLLHHHPSKGQPVPGQAARGSGVLPAFVDIDLELHPFTPGAPPTAAVCCWAAAAGTRRRRRWRSPLTRTPRPTPSCRRNRCPTSRTTGRPCGRCWKTPPSR